MKLRPNGFSIFKAKSVPIADMLPGDRFTDIGGERVRRERGTYLNRPNGCPAARRVDVSGAATGEAFFYCSDATGVRGWDAPDWLETKTP